MLLMILPMLSFTGVQAVHSRGERERGSLHCAPQWRRRRSTGSGTNERARAVIIALIYRIYCRSSMIISTHRHEREKVWLSGNDLSLAECWSEAHQATTPWILTMPRHGFLASFFCLAEWHGHSSRLMVRCLASGERTSSCLRGVASRVLSIAFR